MLPFGAEGLLDGFMIFTTISDLRGYLMPFRTQKIGFVPTMGALHEGHLALVKEALRQNEVVVVSIFVNPIQFNNVEDLAKYPRTLENDAKLLEEVSDKVIIFAPQEQEMYAQKPKTILQFGALEEVMEGKFRKGHFNGVAMVVSRLFHIVMPDNAYFGQKDWQQCCIIKQITDDLLFPLQLHFLPTLRENTGLAMSSRNIRLSPKARTDAKCVYEGLLLVKNFILDNIGKENHILEKGQETGLNFYKNVKFEVEYLEIVQKFNLISLSSKDYMANIPMVICVAGYMENVRLIDNLML